MNHQGLEIAQKRTLILSAVYFGFWQLFTFTKVSCDQTPSSLSMKLILC